MKLRAKLAEEWHDFLTSGIEFAEEGLAASRVRFVNLFSVVAILILLVFGAYNIITGDLIPGSIELLVVLGILINQIALRRHQRIDLAAQIYLLVIAIPLMVLLLTGGISGTGIFWFPAFPVTAYLILGRRHGSTAMLILILIMVLMALVENFQLVELAYSFVTIRQMIFTLLILAILMYVYENLRETGIKQADARTQALAKAYRQLEESEQRQDEFISILAHELRAPMVAIQKLSEVWQSKKTDMPPEKVTQYLGLISKSTAEMLTLVNALLDVARMESGKFEIKPAKNNLEATIKEVVALNEARFQQAGLDLTYIYDPATPQHLAYDEARIKQALNNLLSNAIKFTAEDHPVTIQVLYKGADTTLDQTINNQDLTWYIQNADRQFQSINNHVIIAVSHPEAGIKEQDIRRLFKKFARLEQQPAGASSASTGLGLYILKNIVDGHGGTVGVDSILGEGVTFYFTLPYSEQVPRGGHTSTKN